MSFIQLKTDFLNYLKKEGNDVNSYQDGEDIDIRVFEKSDELTKYAKEVLKLNIDEKISIFELQNLEMVDGQFVDKTNNSNKFNFVNFLNELIKDKKIIEMFDTGNKDGKLDKEEIKPLLAALNVVEDNSDTDDNDNLSVQEVFDGITKAGKDELITEQAKSEDITPSVESPVKTSHQETTPRVSTQKTAPNSLKNLKEAGTVEKVIEDPEEIDKIINTDIIGKESEIKDLKNQLKTESDKRDTLNGTLYTHRNGTSKEVSAAKNQKKTAYNAYKEAAAGYKNAYDCDLQYYITSVEDSRKEVETLEDNVEVYNTEIENLNISLNLLTSSLGKHQQKLSTLKSIKQDNLTDEQKNKINHQINYLENTVITQLEKDIKAGNAAIEREQTKKTQEEEKLKLAKEQLEHAENDLAEFEAELLKWKPEIKQYMDNYKQADQNYVTTRKNCINKTKQEIKISKKRIQELGITIREKEEELAAEKAAEEEKKRKEAEAAEAQRKQDEAAKQQAQTQSKPATTVSHQAKQLVYMSNNTYVPPELVGTKYEQTLINWNNITNYEYNTQYNIGFPSKKPKKQLYTIQNGQFVQLG